MKRSKEEISNSNAFPSGEIESTGLLWIETPYPSGNAVGHKLYTLTRNPPFPNVKLNVELEVIVPNDARKVVYIDATFKHWLFGKLNTYLRFDGVNFNVMPARSDTNALHSRFSFLPVFISKHLIRHVILNKVKKALETAPNEKVKTALKL